MRDATIDVKEQVWALPKETGMAYGWTTRWSWRLFAVSLPLSIASTHVALALLIAAAFFRFRAGELRWKKTPLEKVLVIYLIVCAVTAAVGLLPSKAALQIVSFWHISIYWLMVNTISKDEEIRRLIGLVLLGAALNSLTGIAQQGLNPDNNRQFLATVLVNVSWSPRQQAWLPLSPRRSLTFTTRRSQ